MKKLYFLLAAFFCSFSLYAQPAVFTVNSTQICMPDNLVCTDITTGVTVTSWSWTIDGVEVSTEQNPTIFIDGYTPGSTLLLCMDIVFDLGQDHQSCMNIQVEDTPQLIDLPDGELSCVEAELSYTALPVTPGNYEYTWSGPMGTVNNQTISITVPGVYFVEIKDAITGCIGEEIFIGITADTNIPVADAGSNQLVDCDSPINITLDANGSSIGPNYSYQWTTANGTIVSGANTLNPVVTSTGVYTIIVVDNVNGCQNTDDVFVYDSGFLISASSDAAICLGESVVLTVDAPDAVSYYWLPSGENSNSITASPFTTTTYTVMAMDANGCSGIESMDVIVNPNPIPAIAVPGLLCPDSDFEICTEDVPGYTYLWEDPQGNVSITNCINVNNPDVLSNGTYSLTITNPSGCTSTANFTHTVPDQLLATISFQNPTCFGSGDGSVSVTATGGTPPFTFEWGGGIICQSTDCFNLVAGIYDVIVTDANGCTVQESVTITEPSLMTILDYTVECVGDDGTGGAIDIENTGGVAPYAYLWSNNQVTQDIENLSAGTYTVEITDNNNCVLITTYEVPANCVWPGDTDTNNVVNHFDLLNLGLVYDSIGFMRNDASLSWYGHPSQDWMQTIPGTSIDSKHADTDGNGMIDVNDTLAISLNWGQSHNLIGSSASPRNTVPLYVQQDTISQGEAMSLAIILGDMDNPAIDIYGIAFSVSYDTSVVSFGSSDISFMNSWFGTKGLDMITIQKDFPVSGRVDLAISRTDGMNITGNGEIGRLNIIIEDDILLMSNQANPRGGDEEQEMQFVISGVKMINNAGDVLEVNPLTTTSIITKFPLSNPTNPVLDYQVELYPNPTKDLLTIHSGELTIENIEVFSMMGQLLMNQSADSNKIFLETEILHTGTYLLRIKTNQGTILKRANIVR